MATFTLFVVLPSEEVCSLRKLRSGVSIRDIRCRLEMDAGLPAQTYKLTTNCDQILHEDHVLEIGQNVWDGFLVRVQLLDCWQPLYDAVIRGDVGWLLRSGAVRLKNILESEDQQRTREIIIERGAVALYFACWTGAIKICQGLLSAGVNPNEKTPFRRTSIYAAVARDNDRVLETLLSHGAKLSVKDFNGDSPLDVARRSFSRQCVNRIRSFQLIRKGHMTPRSISSRNIGITSVHQDEAWGGNSMDGSVVSTPRARSNTRQNRPQTSKSSRTVDDKQSHYNERGENKYHQTQTNNGAKKPQQSTNSKILLSLSHAKSNVISNGRSSKTEQQVIQPTMTNGMRYNVALHTPKTPGKKLVPMLNNIVSWNDPFSETELLSVRSAHREGKVQIYPHSSSYTQSLHAPDGSSYAISSTATHSSHGPSPEPAGRPPSSAENRSVASLVTAPGGFDDSSYKSFDNRSIESAPHLTSTEVGPENDADDKKGTNNTEKKSIRFGSAQSSKSFRRNLLARRKQAQALETAKRQIQLAEQQKRASTAKGKRKETFEQWLQKKRRERNKSVHDSDSSSSDSDDERNTTAFNDWLKEVRERPTHQTNPNSAVSLHKRKTRALQGLIGIGNTTVDGPPVAPDTSSYMNAFQDWRKQRETSSDQGTACNDAKEAKRRLEEKRQELLAMAVTFDEWMSHTEERKQLMKVILQADSKKLDEIERTKFQKKESKAISFQQWRNKLEEREAQQRAQQLRMRKEVGTARQMQTGHSGQELVMTQKSHTHRQQEQYCQPQPTRQRPGTGLRRGPTSMSVSS